MIIVIFTSLQYMYVHVHVHTVHVNVLVECTHVHVQYIHVHVVQFITINNYDAVHLAISGKSQTDSGKSNSYH